MLDAATCASNMFSVFGRSFNSGFFDMTTLIIISLSLLSPRNGLGREKDPPAHAQSHVIEQKPDVAHAPQHNMDACNKQDVKSKEPPWKQPEWWLVWLGFPFLAIITWQTIETHKSADAARSSANATLRQVKQSITTDRPWLLIKVTFNGTGYTFRAHNTGKSPCQNYMA